MNNLIRAVRRDIYMNGERTITNAELLSILLVGIEMKEAEKFKQDKYLERLADECCDPNG